MKDREKTTKHTAIKIIVALILIITAIVIICNIIPKEPPIITTRSTMEGLEFEISAKDNYKYIIIQVELLKENNEKVREFTLRADKMKKGELRILKYDSDLLDKLTYDKVIVTLKELQ